MPLRLGSPLMWLGTMMLFLHCTECDRCVESTVQPCHWILVRVCVMSINTSVKDLCHNANSVHSHSTAVGCLLQHSCAVVTKATVGWWARWPFLRQWLPLATRLVLNGAVRWTVTWRQWVVLKQLLFCDINNTLFPWVCRFCLWTWKLLWTADACQVY